MRRRSVEHADPRLGNNVFHDFSQVPGCVVNHELAIRARPHLQHLVDVVQLLARPQLIRRVAHQVKVLQHEVAHGDLFFLAEVNQVATQSVARGAKFVFHDQGAAVDAITLVRRVQLPQHVHGRLDQRCDRDGLIQTHGNVANPNFQGVEKWMRANVPPYFLAVVDTVCLDQQIEEGLILRPVCKNIGNVGAWEALEHLAAVRLEPGFHAHPERRIREQGQDVRQKIPQRIHDVDGGVAVLNADMHVQPKHQVGAGDELHVLDHLAIALVGINLLRLPIGKRMRACSAEQQAVCVGQRYHFASQFEDVGPRFLNVLADMGPNFDNRLVHFCFGARVGGQDRLGKNLRLDVRPEVKRLRVDRLVFLFDSDAKARPLHLYYPLVALFGAFTALLAFGIASALTSVVPPPRKALQRYSDTLPVCSLALWTANSATASTIQWKFSSPTELMSASGAGFMKSMAYGIPSSQANSTVLRSYPRARHSVRASRSTRSSSLGSTAGGFFTYRSWNGAEGS